MVPFETGTFLAVIIVLRDQIVGFLKVYEVSVSIVHKIKMNRLSYLGVYLSKFYATYSNSFSLLLQASKTIQDIIADPSIPPTPIVAVLGKFSLNYSTVS